MVEPAPAEALGHPAGIGLGEGDELRGRREWRARTSHQHIGPDAAVTTPTKVARRIEREVAVEAGHRGDPLWDSSKV